MAPATWPRIMEPKDPVVGRGEPSHDNDRKIAQPAVTREGRGAPIEHDTHYLAPGLLHHDG